MPYLLILLGVFARLVPHAWNFTPVGAIGLFAGANCNPRIAWLVPIGALLIADLIIGLYDPLVMIFVYLGFAAAPLMGRLFLYRQRSILRFGGAVTASATTFYLMSNFGMWLAAFPHSVQGFIECYVRGLPYYGVTLIGDGLCTAILFGLQAIIVPHAGQAENAIQA